MTNDTVTGKPTVVWSEIPVSDLDAACTFYRAVFGWTMTIREMGPNPAAVFNNVGEEEEHIGGHLYPGKPAGDGTGPTLHLMVPGSLEEACTACDKAGGQVISPPIDIPQGRFAYALDPDGNSLGLFEAKAA